MNFICNYISNGINNYCESHTPKDEEFLKPVERARVTRYLDVGGKILIVGALAGLIRTIGSIAIGFIAAIGICMSSKKPAINNYCIHLVARASDELSRGVCELFTAGFIVKCIESIEKKGEDISKGFIRQGGVYGNYVYKKHGSLFYSETAYEGRGERVEGGGWQFDDDAVEAVTSKSTLLYNKK